MKILKFEIGDIVELKKQHPCGCKQFKVLRVGGEMRVCCVGCGRDLTIDRLKLEKAVKKFIFGGEQNEQNK